MNSLLLYLAQSAACLLLFFGFYHLVLRHERSFQFNRVYLLLTPLLALTLPLLRIPIVVPEPVAEVTWVYALPYEEATVVVAAEEEGLTLAAVLPWLVAGLYLAGVLYFAFRLLRQLMFVRRLLQTRRHLALPWQDCVVVPTEGQTPTFSFLRYIFWNDQPPVSAAEKAQILAHERVHVVQRHSLDVLYLAALQILLWINPLLLLYQKALAETHEYIADETVVRSGSGNAHSYAQLVVRQLFWRLERPIGSFFSSSQTLNRIAMLKKTASVPKLWKKLLALPVLALSVALFSFQLSPLLEEGIPAPFSNEVAVDAAAAPVGVAVTSAARTVTGKVTGADTQAGLAGASVVVKGSTRGTATNMAGEFSLEIPENHDVLFISYIGYETAEITVGGQSRLAVLLQREVRQLDEVKAMGQVPTPTDAPLAPAAEGVTQGAQQNPVYTYVEQMPTFKAGKAAMVDFLSQNMRYPASAKAAGVAGIVVVNFVVKIDGTLSDFEIVRNLTPEIDQEALRVAEAMQGRWEPGRQNGRPVNTKVTLPLRFQPEASDNAAPSKPFTYVEQMPTFEGGPVELAKYLGANIKYPQVARKAGIQGLVVVEFVIHQDGSLTEAKVVKSLSPETDQEALRVVQSMSGKWRPGRQNGAPVDVKFTLPIRFDMGTPALTLSPIREFWSKNIRYPSEAVQAGAEGRVLVDFTLHPDGTVTGVATYKKAHEALNREAERVVKASTGKWSAQDLKGATAPIRYTLPINFAFDSPSLATASEPVHRRGKNYLPEIVVISYNRPETGTTEAAIPTTPQFRGGPEALQQHLREKIKFASPTAQRPVDGIVTIRLTVNSDGTLSQVKLVDQKFKNIKVVGESSLNYLDPKQFDGGQRQLINDLSQQALEVVRATSGQWTPGEKNGRKLKSTFNVEIPIKYP